MKILIDEHKIWENDVKSMSYDDLMTAIRFLDEEREMLSRKIHEVAEEQNNKFSRKEKIERQA